MIEFNYETDFELANQIILEAWITQAVTSENFELGHLSFVFCDDAFLHKLNLEFLNHDTLTDILSFDYGLGKQVNGEIFISIERVAENATAYDVSFETELHRVIIHGVFHLCGYKDESQDEEATMRLKEDEALWQLSFLLQA